MGTGTGSGDETEVKRKRGMKPPPQKKKSDEMLQNRNWVKVGMEEKLQKTKRRSFVSFVFGVAQERRWTVSVGDEVSGGQVKTRVIRRAARVRTSQRW